MPRNAKHPCRDGRCPELLDKSGYCDKHRRAPVSATPPALSEAYKERNRFYQRAAWKRIRAEHLQLEPLCRKCRSIGRLIEAAVVDHIITIESGGAKLDHGNLQSLCTSCHNAKTRRDTNKPRGASNLHKVVRPFASP